MSVVGFHCSAGGSPASPPPFTTRLSPLHVLGSSVEHELCVCARVCACAVEVGAPPAQRPHLDRRSDPGSEARAAPWAGLPQRRRGGRTEPRAPPSGALAFNPSPPLGAARPAIFRRQRRLSGSSCMQWRRRCPPHPRLGRRTGRMACRGWDAPSRGAVCSSWSCLGPAGLCPRARLLVLQRTDYACAHTHTRAHACTAVHTYGPEGAAPRVGHGVSRARNQRPAHAGLRPAPVA